MRWAGFVLLLAGCGAVPPGSEPPKLRAGVARECITPNRNVPLGGYGARQGKPMTGVHDDVWVRALYLECDGRRLLWLTSDLCLIVREIREAVRQALALRPEELLVCASHSHSAPGPYFNHPLAATAMGRYDPEFARWLQERFVAAGRSAMADARPAKIGFGYGTAELSRNRRNEEVTDPTVRVLRILEPDGRHRATLVQFTTHPTVIGSKNMLVSGDFPGAFCRHLEARLGGTALYVNGAEGDQGPRAPPGKDEFERADRMGEELARVAAAVRTDERSSLRIRSVIEEVRMAPTLPLLMPDRTWLQAVRLDEVLLLAVPGEMTLALGNRVLEAIGHSPAWFVGLANDYLAYFVTPEQYKKGGYERDMCFYGERVQDVFVKQYPRLADMVK